MKYGKAVLFDLGLGGREDFTCKATEIKLVRHLAELRYNFAEFVKFRLRDIHGFGLSLTLMGLYQVNELELSIGVGFLV